MKKDYDDEIDDKQVNEIIKALQAPGGFEIFKKILDEQLPEEMSQPLKELVDGKLKTQDEVMAKMNDNILDSYNAGKINKKQMKLMMGGKISKKDLEKLGNKKGKKK